MLRVGIRAQVRCAVCYLFAGWACRCEQEFALQRGEIHVVCPACFLICCRQKFLATSVTVNRVMIHGHNLCFFLCLPPSVYGLETYSITASHSASVGQSSSPSRHRQRMDMWPIHSALAAEAADFCASHSANKMQWLEVESGQIQTRNEAHIFNSRDY